MRNLSFLVLALVLASPLVAAEPKQPDVLFIAVDDLNHWVAHLGRNRQAKTPNIDRLAARGVTFTQAHCAAPVCNPSRAALLSGMRPSTTAVYSNGDFWMSFLREGQTLPAQFLKAGYHVAGAGKIFHGDTYFRGDWSEYMKAKSGGYHGAGVAKEEGFLTPVAHDLADDDLRDWQAVDWCIERLQNPPEGPLFLACGLHKPHLPFVVPRKYYDMFPLDEIELPPYREDDLDDIPPAGVAMASPRGDHRKILESGRWKEAIQSYLAAMAYTDANVGRLLDALDASPRAAHTIVVLFGDHGWHFGEKHHWRKFALWEEATRAPLIWVVPGVTKPGGVCARPVDFMTIFPTLCDVTGVAVPEYVEGASIRNLLADPASETEGVAITTHEYRNHAVRTARWRYIRYADGSEELYDHDSDPYEWTNLAGRVELQSVKDELKSHLPASDAPPRKSRGKNKNKEGDES